MFHRNCGQFSLPVFHSARTYPFLLALVIFIIGLTGCGQQRGDLERSAGTFEPPTLTPLSTDWVALTLVFEDSAESEVKLDATQQPNTATATPAPTVTDVSAPPIATATVAELIQPMTPTSAPTSTPIPIPTRIPTATPIPEAVLQTRIRLASRSSSNAVLNLYAIQEQIRFTQDDLHNLNYIISRVQSGRDLNCSSFVASYHAVRDNSPYFRNAMGEMELTLFHYNRAVETALVDMYPLYDQCQQQARPGESNYLWLHNDAIDSDALEVASGARVKMLQSINDALAWSNGDLRKTRTLYLRVQIAINRLSFLIEEGSTLDCPEILDIYEETQTFPRLTPAVGDSQKAYRHYLDAIRYTREAAEIAGQYCQTYVNRYAEVPEAEWPELGFPNDLLIQIRVALSSAATAMATAIELLPFPAPEPTVVPVRGVVQGSGTSTVPDHYEVVIKVNFLDSGQAYASVRIGEFEMDSANIITVVHRCDLDFNDTIHAVTESGEIASSLRVSAERHTSCYDQ